MFVKILRPIKGYGYFAGDTAEFPADLAAELVASGRAVAVPETEGVEGECCLPEDMPMRELLWRNGYVSVGQVSDAGAALTGIPGIGEASARRILEYCMSHGDAGVE